MEKVPAACAMEWSIELEKGLRSKRPGQPITVIEQIGSKLLKWSKESCVNLSASRMYGLVPGEERTFTNTILWRLVDAFRSGDNCMRACILKVFLLELRHIKEKGRNYGGILSKQRLPNYLELLKIVRISLDTGDAKARALSLRLLGCWAPLTHDNAEVQHILLLSMRSDHVLEVKASLFASSCLCRLSDDFARIFLGILVDIICSVSASSGVKLAAARAFGEIQCSSLIASRAYKSGKKLVLESPMEDYIVEMLSSLSKLAVKSVTLIPEQADILLSFVSTDCAPVIKSMALKCIRFLLRGFTHFPVNGNVFSTLFHKIDDPALPLDLQCDVLKTLHELFNGLPKIFYEGVPEFPTLVMIVERASQSSYIAKRDMVLSLLVDISCNANVARHDLLAKHVILLLIDHITSMTKNMHMETDRGTIFLEDAGFNGAAYELKQKYSILFNHILRLIVEYPALGLMVLSRFRSLIEDLVCFHPAFNVEVPRGCGDISEMEIDADKPIEFQECDKRKHAQYASEIVLHICSFVIPCLNVLDENGLAGAEVCAVLKLLVDCLQRIEFCNSDACEMVSFHMRSYIISHCCGVRDNTLQILSEPNGSLNHISSEDDCWVNHESLALGFARRMMNRRKYWMVYRVGKYSSGEGLWFAATYAFRRLIDEAKSDSCRCWLKCLTLLAGAESEMKLLLFPKLGIRLTSELCTDNDCRKPCEGDKEEIMENYDGGIAFMLDKGEKLSRVHRRICSSREILPVVGMLTGAFWFQHWFLNLRGKVLEILLDVLGHLNSHLNSKRNLDGHVPAKQNLGIFSSLSGEDMNFLSSHFSCIAFQLNKLAREYDFLTSCMHMDPKSSRVISRLALYCSLMAFCAGFPFYLSGLSGNESLSSNSGCSENSTLLLEDLVRRLFYAYGVSATDLEKYIPCGGWLRGCLQSRKQISRFNHMDGGIVFVSRFAISGFHHLRQEVKEAKHKEDIFGIFRKGLQLLCNILVKWMTFPFQTPKYFFRVRHCRGAELFVDNAHIGNAGKLCVLPGNQLCLNLCIQLRNISSEYCASISKIYCILAARSSGAVSEGNKEREGGVFAGFQAWKTEDIVDLNELLLSSMENKTKSSHKMQGVPVNEVDLVTACVCVVPNERGQGFSTCLLDVSGFPEGAYQIKWHSCCVDKNDNYWSLPALNDAIIFTVKRPSAT